MKTSVGLAAVFVTILFALTSFAQTPPTGPSKIAVLNSMAFGDDRAGIVKLINAYKALQAEFKPVTDDLANMNSQIQKIAADIQALQAKLNGPQVPGADTKALQAEIDQKTDDGTRMQLELKRKQEDAKAKFEKREKQTTDPIFKEIGDALDAYAKRNSIDLIVDPSKTNAVLLFSNAIDVTESFIKEFNAKQVGVPVK